jgi:uncharacterized membrane protein YczE
MPRLRPADLGARGSLLVLGSALATYCYALTIRADLGLGPLFVVQQGLARSARISIGHAVMVVGVALVIVAVGLRSWPGPGTLVLPFMGGAMLDAVLPSVPVVHSLILRLFVVVGATWCMALGGSLIIRASVGVAAYDAVMLGLRRITGRPLAPIRLIMELTMLGCGWALGGSVGVGTVLTGLLIGPALQFWLAVLTPTSTPPPQADGWRSRWSRRRWSRIPADPAAGIGLQPSQGLAAGGHRRDVERRARGDGDERGQVQSVDCGSCPAVGGTGRGTG